MLSLLSSQGRILYKDGDATESVYWLVEGAVTVSCEINVIDTGSSFNFGAFATSHASSTSAASSLASSKRPSRLTKLRGMLQAAFAFKKVRWGKEVRIQDDAEASEGSTVEATTMSMYPDADVRVVLDYMTAPDIFGDFEVIRQDAVRRTTVHSSSSKTQLYRLSKPLFKLLVLENVRICYCDAQIVAQ
jgi:CRP-like cAMP-binding protein